MDAILGRAAGDGARERRLKKTVARTADQGAGVKCLGLGALDGGGGGQSAPQRAPGRGRAARRRAARAENASTKMV